MTVHDVNVQQVGPAFLHTRDRFAQTAEISGQNRWGYQAAMPECHFIQ